MVLQGIGVTARRRIHEARAGLGTGVNPTYTEASSFFIDTAPNGAPFGSETHFANVTHTPYILYYRYIYATYMYMYMYIYTYKTPRCMHI